MVGDHRLVYIGIRSYRVLFAIKYSTSVQRSSCADVIPIKSDTKAILEKIIEKDHLYQSTAFYKLQYHAA